MDKIEVDRRIRQGDTISLKLFTSGLEDIFKELSWEGKGMNIDGTYLNHLLFADDTVLISSDIKKVEQILIELHLESRKVTLSQR